MRRERSIIPAVSGLQGLEVVSITRPLGRTLHREQRVERAHAHGRSREVHFDGVCGERTKRRDLRKPLEDANRPEIGRDQRPITRAQEPGDGVGAEPAL